MRRLLHLSDLHFGRTDPAVIEPLLDATARIAPDLVVVSGDLTQRARAAEFEAARKFLDRLRLPFVVVPGNHDVPLYRVWERFLSPMRKYRRYVGDDLEPTFVDDEIAVLGINTARSSTLKGGRINEAQMQGIQARFAALPATLTKVVVTHHPFDLPDDPGDAQLVGRAGQAMAVFARCGVDLLLAGHFHSTQAGESSTRYPIPGYAALVIQAGTATSTRGRGEANSFNVIHIGRDEVVVEPWVWQAGGAAFVATPGEQFRREASRWAATEEG